MAERNIWGSIRSFNRSKFRRSPTPFSNLYKDNFDHDTETLQILAKNINDATNVLQKEQRNIRRKQSKVSSKKLQTCIEKYNIGLLELKFAAHRIIKIIGTDTDKCITRERTLSPGEQQTQCSDCSSKDATLQILEEKMKSVHKQRRQSEDRLKKVQLLNEELQNRYHGQHELLQQKGEEEKQEEIIPLQGRLQDHYPCNSDLCDPIRPTKVAEKLLELFDNQRTDAFEALEGEMGERQIIQTLLDTLMAVYHECHRLASEQFFEQVKQSIALPAEATTKSLTRILLPEKLKQHIKEFRKRNATYVVKDIEKVVKPKLQLANHKAMEVQDYISCCVEIGWFCAVQDPPLVLNAESTAEFDTDAFKTYAKRGKYVEYVVWPVMYLHDGGSLLAKGVAQCTDQVIRCKPRYDNPNITDLGDPNRPIRKAHKLPELNCNQWTDLFEAFKRDNDEKQVIQALLDTLLAVVQECLRLSNENFFENVQRSIELPTEAEPQTADAHTDTDVVLPEKLKEEIKEFRKSRAGCHLKEIEKVVKLKIPMPYYPSREVDTYFSQCVEIGWLCAVQYPPLVLKAQSPISVDTDMPRIKTKYGEYNEYAMSLYERDVRMAEGVAEGCSNFHDNNSNIVDLSDLVNRPTRVAEKITELYANQWKDAFDVLAAEMGERQAIRTLLDALMTVYHECRKLSSENFFNRVQRNIELPAEATVTSIPEVAIPEQVKQAIREFRKIRAGVVVKDIEKILKPKLELAKHQAQEIQEYISCCVEIGWLCAVQHPPLALKVQSSFGFDINVFKHFTKPGKYVEYVVWPAMYLHEGGPIIAKGVAQGDDDMRTPLI